MVRTLSYGQETGLNPARIAGISVAILVHAAAFLLLLIPATLPPLARPLETSKPELVIIPKQTPVSVPIEATKPAEPVKPTPVARTPIVLQTPVATPAPITVDAPSALPAIVEASTPGDVATPSESVMTNASSSPVSASHLAYVRAPAPVYPRSAMRERAEGTVLLRVLVDVDGSPLEVSIETSSGNRELDRAARTQVLKQWKFQPAMQDGRAVQAYGRVPVNFSLR